MKRLKELRTLRGLTQEEFGKKIGQSKSNISLQIQCLELSVPLENATNIDKSASITTLKLFEKQ